ncbi:hypothetical protein AQUCO_11000029v1 [Aquilegia coerulea]|uniref:Transmembrane protein n=1 Tax=Aquilegia coerulea TaxID=218851 RepID=A0A2G5C2Z5_AQUCA|nr:hypothetical protein AQUCO_11000029v1 [Aquilegia coerulea]
MAIIEKLMKYKFHIIFITSLSSVLILSIFLIAPNFLTILSYFWPLFLSTALFLFSIVFFGKVSPLAFEETSSEKTGEGLLDYVAGQSHETIHNQEEDEGLGDDEEEKEEK